MFFLPYRDDNPTQSVPIVNWCLILLNTWVFFYLQYPLESQEQSEYYSKYGFIPATFMTQFSGFQLERIGWEWFTVLSSMFSHGGIPHLLGNMLFLYLYGDNLEDAMGKIRYIVFFLSCGLLAAIAQSLIDPTSQIPMVGASGAISGVIAGYLLLYPRANIRVFYWFFVFIGTIFVPAYLVLGLWIAGQILAFPESLAQSGGVAVTAHIGGFLSGLILTPFFRLPKKKLFNQRYSRAFSRHTRRFFHN